MASGDGGDGGDVHDGVDDGGVDDGSPDGVCQLQVPHLKRKLRQRKPRVPTHALEYGVSLYNFINLKNVGDPLRMFSLY